ncbi:hypothetical protein DNTS_025477 [Danionella cerebrum]|uniref:Tumor protein D52 n=1 Tax=Danionella cerebrum TaxID=2873325 RepID=A0A553Q376_9TELE|nr:hypothetical protein DNTS_025477 [Danionella translucida]
MGSVSQSRRLPVWIFFPSPHLTHAEPPSAHTFFCMPISLCSCSPQAIVCPDKQIAGQYLGYILFTLGIQDTRQRVSEECQLNLEFSGESHAITYFPECFLFVGSMEEPVEDYKSPFNFEQGVNTSYLYLSPEESFTPPGSPLLSFRGTQRQDFIPEVGEEAVDGAPDEASTGLTAEQEAELRSELAKVEDEIQTLSQVLAAKEKQVAEIKRKLGITPLNELRQNLSKGWHEVTTSTAYVPSLTSGVRLLHLFLHQLLANRLKEF